LFLCHALTKLAISSAFEHTQIYRIVSCMPSSCVCPSICLSQAGTEPKWLNVGSHEQLHTIVQGL